jgi:capsid protein
MGLIKWFQGDPAPATPTRKPTSTTIRKIFGAFGFDIWGGSAYDAASSGRRRGPNGSIQGPNLITLESWLALIRASRHKIRNSSLASSAIQKFESNMVGTGIQPHFTHPDPQIKLTLQKAWAAWVKQADHSDQLSFYGLQALVARQLFEAGEVFCRYHVVDDGKNYFQLQLIETEQVPVYYNSPGGMGGKDDIRMGILFDPSTDKRVAYRMYSTVNPYDNIGYSRPNVFVNISADEMIQVMKPLRPGDLRGTPIMAPVLTLLDDIDGYADSERLRKRLAACLLSSLRNLTAKIKHYPLMQTS